MRTPQLDTVDLAGDTSGAKQEFLYPGDFELSVSGGGEGSTVRAERDCAYSPFTSFGKQEGLTNLRMGRHIPQPYHIVVKITECKSATIRAERYRWAMADIKQDRIS